MTRRPKRRFRLDRLGTPIGFALVVQDEDGRLRALDWEDHEARMIRLLRLHYGDDGVELVAGDGSGRIAGALRDYLAGELGALDAVAVETAGTEFQRRVWRELRRIRPGTTLSYGSSPGGSDVPTPCVRSDSPTARIPSASSCPATGSSAPTAA